MTPQETEEAIMRRVIMLMYGAYPATHLDRYRMPSLAAVRQALREAVDLGRAIERGEKCD